MVGMIGTELSLISLVEDFLREQSEAEEACRRGAGWLGDEGAKDTVMALAGTHRRDLDRLRELAHVYGAPLPEDGTQHEAQTLGRLDRAHAQGDRAILDELADLESKVMLAYERALTSTVLPESVKPTFTQALAEIRRRYERLATARMIAG